MNKVGRSLAIVALAISPLAVCANDKNMKISGYDLSVGDIKTIPIMVSENIAAADGDIAVSDDTCLEIINVESAFGSDKYFAAIDLNGNAITKAADVTVKALKECSANIIINNASMSSFDALDEESGLTFISKDINVLAKEEKNVEVQIPEVKVETTKNEEKETTEEKIVETKNEIVETKEEETKSFITVIFNILNSFINIFRR